MIKIRQYNVETRFRFTKLWLLSALILHTMWHKFWDSIVKRSTKLVSLLVSLLFSAIFALSFQSLTTPSSLFLFLSESDSDTTKVEVEWVFPGGILWEFGVRPGDQVLMVDQQVPTPQDVLKQQWQSVVIKDSDGSIVAVDIRVNVNKQNTLPLLLISPIFLLFGVLIFLRAGQQSISQKYFLLFVSIAFALVVSPLSENDVPIGLSMGFITITFLPSFYLLFFLSFPDKDVSFRSIVIIFAPSIVVSLFFVISLFEIYIYDIALLLRLIVLLIYFSLSIIWGFYSMTKINAEKSKQGMFIVNSGNIIAILPSIVLYILPALLGLDITLPSEYTILSIVFMPIAFGYAILYYDVLKINLLQRWLVRGIIWISVFVLIMGIVILLRYIFFGREAVNLYSNTFFVVLVMMIGYFFGKIQLLVWNFVDRLVFKDNYNYNIVIQQISRDLSITSNNQILMTELMDNLKKIIHASFVIIMSKRDNNVSLLAASSDIQKQYMDEAFKFVELTDHETQVTLLPDVQDYGVFMYVTLRIKDVIIGYICVGPKVNKEPFRTADKDLLVTLSGQIAALIQNEQLVEDLHNKVHALDVLNERLYRTQEEERVRLSADIHDEPLQTALHLQRQLMIASTQEANIADYTHLSQTLVDQLRRVCTEMRPAVLDDLGLHAALDALAQEQSERMGAPIILDISMALIDKPLGSSTELVLYRVTQEAINNCVRHAHPRFVIIRLGYQDDLILLSVEDDGVGFNVPDNLDSFIECGHLGLAGLLNRVQHIGGKLTISSTPGEGTQLKVSFPVEVVQP